MEKIIGTLPSQMGFRQPDGGEGVMDILRGGSDASHFSQRKGVLGCYFDSLVGRHQPRLRERFCGPETPFLWGVERRNACSRDCRRIWFLRGSHSPSRGLRKCADIAVGRANRVPGSISEPAVSTRSPECGSPRDPQLLSRRQFGHETGSGRVRWETNGCIIGAAGRPKWKFQFGG